MLKIGECQNVQCFDKSAQANGYKRNVSFKQNNSAMADYADIYEPANGIANRMSWVEVTGRKNTYHYAAFLFTGATQMDKFAKEIDNNQYKTVGKKTIGNLLSQKL